MGTKEIIWEINKLNEEDRFALIEQLTKGLHQEEKIRLAVEKAVDDYTSDGDLTAFTNIDSDEFYESR